MPDEKDRVFFDVAKCCRARLLTGNMKHYPVDELVTAPEELCRLEADRLFDTQGDLESYEFSEKTVPWQRT